MGESVPEIVIIFIERIKRETGAYPREVALTYPAWVEMYKWGNKICLMEEATETKGASMVLSQGTRIRLVL